LNIIIQFEYLISNDDHETHVKQI